MGRFGLGLDYPAISGTDRKLIRVGDKFQFDDHTELVVKQSNFYIETARLLNKKEIAVTTYPVEGESVCFSRYSNTINIHPDSKRKFVKLYRILQEGGMN